MLVLDGTSELIAIKLDSSPTTELDFFASYMVDNGSSLTAENNSGTSSGTTDVTVVPSPGSGEQHLIKSLVVQSDTGNGDINTQIKFDDGTNQRVIVDLTLLGGGVLQYTEGEWTIFQDTTESGSKITLDIDDDGSNESTDLAEIATTNEPSSPIASEPTADKALLDWNNITSIAGVGNVEVLASDTVSSGSALDLKAGLTGSFPYYILMWSGFFPASDGQDLYLRTSDDGTNFESGTSDYSWTYVQRDAGGGEQQRNSGSDSKIRLGEGAETKTTSAIPGQGKALLRGVEGDERTTIRWESAGNQDGTLRSRNGAGARAAATTDQAFRLLYSGSNISEGRAAIYGVST